MDAKQTPLIDLLERVPADARMVYEHDQFHSQNIPVGRLCHEAAAALKAALEQPDYWEEEARRYAGNADFWREKYEALEQPEQEPVAWMMVNKTHSLGPSLHWAPQTDWHITWEAVPLYAHPPRREWRGLTEEDEIPWDGVDVKSFAKAIEAALKEKNYE